VYPREEWNFVYGIADIMNGVGVWSFARLDPQFPSIDDNDKEPSDTDKTIILRRCVKVLVHELTHLFGLKHCIYLTCLMNGANHEEELDHQPLWLCAGIQHT
jgi:archaemetzincin